MKVKREKTPQGPSLGLPAGTSEELDPAKLLLDPLNLRLLERVGESYENMPLGLYGESAVQQKLFAVISADSRFDIASLATSIENNGFLKHERLIVARYDGDKYLVLEGNRRVTAIRKLQDERGGSFQALPPAIRESLRTIPCFVLDGPVIDADDNIAAAYRRAAEIYIGMRHLMGAKSWEPASRYEFQSRLIFSEGWRVDEVAERFGRKKSEVVRDLKAQILYRDFVTFEKTKKVEHTLTYNAFNEAARAPAIMKWLGWSDAKMSFLDEGKKGVFFHYLISRVRSKPIEDDDPPTDVSEHTAEAVVRKLRDMLRLEDHVILEALEDKDFHSAEISFLERREGALGKKVAAFTRLLKRTSTDDLTSSVDTRERLLELQEQIKKLVKVIDALGN